MVKYKVLHLTVVSCHRNVFSDNYLIVSRANSLNKNFVFICLNEIPIGRFITFNFVKRNADGEILKNYKFLIIDNIIFPVQQYYVESINSRVVDAYIYDRQILGNYDNFEFEAIKIKCHMSISNIISYYDKPFSGKINVEFIDILNDKLKYKDNKIKINLGENLLITNLVYNSKNRSIDLINTLVNKENLSKKRNNIRLRVVKKAKTVNNNIVHFLITEEVNVYPNTIFLLFNHSCTLADFESLNLNIKDYSFVKLSDNPKEYVDKSLFFRGNGFIFEECAIISLVDTLDIEECSDTLAKIKIDGYEYHLEEAFQYRNYVINGIADALLYKNPDYSNKEWQKVYDDKSKRDQKDMLDWGFEGDASNLWNID